MTKPLSLPATPPRPKVDRHRLAADVMAVLVGRYGVLKPTMNEAKVIAATAYYYANALVDETARQQA